jgi:hypothetical protein
MRVKLAGHHRQQIRLYQQFPRTLEVIGGEAASLGNLGNAYIGKQYPESGISLQASRRRGWASVAN